jgi:hypothetical protein
MIYNDFNLMVLNGLSNDNEIAWNLKHYKLISKQIYIYKLFLFLNFLTFTKSTLLKLSK